VRGTGRGQFTHMGRIAFEYEHCGNYTVGSWEGTMTFGAADGSTIVAAYAGDSTVDDDAEAYGVATRFAILGGTGRFAGATGGGPGAVWLAWVNAVPLFSGQYTLRMWIDGRIVHAPGKALGR
jgi:hypothetical protein